jgi:hypothetical protein
MTRASDISEGSTFVMYYTANTANGSTHCVGAATPSSIEGPYPFACEFWKLRQSLSCGVLATFGALKLYVL